MNVNTLQSQLLTYVTKPAKIDHLSAKIIIYLFMLYHNLITV